jgi:hypothetical protein
MAAFGSRSGEEAQQEAWGHVVDGIELGMKVEGLDPGSRMHLVRLYKLTTHLANRRRVALAATPPPPPPNNVVALTDRRS